MNRNKAIWFLNSSLILGFLAILTWYIPTNELFEKFMPHSFCMRGNSRLIALYSISDAMIFVSYMVISMGMFYVYRDIKDKFGNWKAFVWMYGVFIFLCGLTHLMAVINLYVAFYWLGAAVEAICAMVSVVVMISFIIAMNQVRGMKTKEEYDQLESKYVELLKRVEKIEKN